MAVNHLVLLVLLILKYVEPENPPLTGCAIEQFSCHNGTCIPDSLLCDDVEDCSNGLDEFVCIDRSLNGCPPDMIQCGDNENECIPLQELCNGVENCPFAEDEANCGMQLNSECLISQFECPRLGNLLTATNETECVPRVTHCDGNIDCIEGGDEQGCSPPVIITQPEPIVSVLQGSNPSFLCVAEGNPVPTVTWLRNLRSLVTDPRYMVISENGMGLLWIRNVTMFDEGEYSCVASNNLQSVISDQISVLNVFDPNPFTCKDLNENQYNEGELFYDIQISTSGDATSAAIDVVFVVDESGSMQEAHEFIRVLTPLLQQEFENAGFGVGNRENQFALVGFGRNMDPGREGVVLTQLTSVEGLVNASRNLMLDGVFEDGYSGIQVALDEINLRNDTSRIMILATDESRQMLAGKEDLTRQVILQELWQERFILNAIVSQGFLYDSSDNFSFAFGLDINRTAYTFDPNSPNDFMSFPNGIRHPDPSFSEGSTYEDYVKLAFMLGGAAWDINQIQMTEDLSVPFINAFSEVKVTEVSGVIRRCVRCLCRQPASDCVLQTEVSIEECIGIASPDPSLMVQVFPMSSFVKEGDNLTLTCRIDITPPASNVQIDWFGDSTDICSTRALCSGNQAVIADFMSTDENTYICFVTANSSGIILTGLSAATATFRSPPKNMITDSPDINEGRPLIITCNATGVPPPGFVWRKIAGDVVDFGRVMIETRTEGDYIVSTLTIDPTVVMDTGTYECVASNTVGMDSEITEIQVSSANCTLPDGSPLALGQYRTILYLDNDALSADIILIVDESGSMELEHRWIDNMTKLLDTVLQSISIGVNTANRFGVVGFGSYEAYTQNRAVSYEGSLFVEASNITLLTQMLYTSGKYEDGYSAIQFAFDNYDFNSGAAKQFILVTDEERDILDASLNRTNILDLLITEGINLNAAISEGFKGMGNLPALGIDSFEKAYIYDPLSPQLYRTLFQGTPIKDTAYSTTNEDYTELALLSGGAAWNLELLRRGETVAGAFTEAFVQVKVEEIYRQLSRCLNCSCLPVTGLLCQRIINFDDIPECNLTKVIMELIPEIQMPSVSIEVDVTPSIQRHIEGSGNAEITCTILQGQGDIVWTFNGGILPEGALVQTTTNISVLSIIPVQLKHKGIYSCLVRNVDDVTIGNDIGIVEVMMLQNLLGLTVDPLEDTITEGQNITFTCSIDEPGHFSWDFNRQSLPNNTIVETSDNTSLLTVISANSINKGRYFCNAIGNISGFEDCDFAKLFVQPPMLKISVNKSVVNATIGDTVKLICKLECFCIGATLMWQRNYTNPLPNNTMVYYTPNGESVLEFTNIQQSDWDLYTCQGELGDQFEVLGTLVIVEPSEDFEAILNRDVNTDVDFGANETLICTSNSPVILWQWTFNGTLVLPDLVQTFNVTNRAVLFICDVKFFHAGTYQCLATNERGEMTSDNSFLRVVGDRPNTGTSSISITSSMASSGTTSTSAVTANTSVTTSVSTPVSTPVSTSVTASASVTTSVTTPLFTSVTASASVTMSVTTPVSTSVTASTSSVTNTTYSSPVTSITSTSSVTSTTYSSPVTSVIYLTTTSSVTNTTYSSPVTSITSTSSVTSTTYSSPVTSSTSTSSVTSTTYSSPVTSSTSTSSVTSTTYSSPVTSIIFPTTASSVTSTTYSSPVTSIIFPTTTPPPLQLNVSDNSVMITSGSNINITCQSNIPTILEWTYTRTNVLPGNIALHLTSRTAVLEIRDYDPSIHQGTYRCTAEADDGTQLAAIEVQVDTRDTLIVVVEPQSIERAMDDAIVRPVQFTCGLDCPLLCGGATVKWTSSGGGPLPDEAEIDSSFSMRDSTLIFKILTPELSGMYECVAMHETLGQVVQTVNLRVLENAEISVRPEEQTLDRGRTAKFTCVANRPVSQFLWTYQSRTGSLPNTASFESNKTVSQLTVEGVTDDENTGQYFCQALFESGEIRSDVGNLIETPTLGIEFDPPGESQVVLVGENIEIECSAVCQCAQLNTEWTVFGGGMFPDNLEQDPSFSGRSSTLESVNGATEEMSGIYVCTITREDTNEVISMTLNLTVVDT